MQKPFDASTTESVLKHIREGMEVYDSVGDRIGTVDTLYFGASSDEMKEHGVGAASAPDPSLRQSGLVDDIVRAIGGENDLPDEMRKRLIHDGFIRIDAAGLFASDRYVLPEQIDRVHDDHVHLNVTGDQLLQS